MTKTKILHLVDDTTPGGVMRVLDHICSCPDMGKRAQHEVLPLKGYARPPRDHGADIIVSHMAVNWRRLLWFIRLRACEAHTPMIHVEHSYTRAFTAENVTPLDAAGFGEQSAAFGEEEWGNLRIAFLPGAAAREVNHDLRAIWNALGEDEWDSVMAVSKSPAYMAYIE